jgi:hypothetical protein
MVVLGRCALQYTGNLAALCRAMLPLRVGRGRQFAAPRVKKILHERKKCLKIDLLKCLSAGDSCRFALPLGAFVHPLCQVVFAAELAGVLA